MRTNLNSGRIINILWPRKTGLWKSGTLSKAPSREHRGSRIRLNRAANISSSFPTDHSRKVAGPNSTEEKSPRNRQTLQSFAGSGLWDRRTSGNQGITIHEEHVQLSVPTGSPQGHLKPVSFIPLNWKWGLPLAGFPYSLLSYRQKLSLITCS